MRAIIIAHGTISDFTLVRALISQTDYIIAADGGAMYAHEMAVKPNILIGDMDSLGEENVHFFARQGVQIIKYPKEKDDSDTQLALNHAIALGYREIVVLGGMGTRIDHSLANIFLCFHDAYKEVNISFQDEFQTILKLRNNSIIKGKQGDVFSLIALEDITGLNIIGAKYPLKNAKIPFGGSLTISNEFLGNEVKISWQQGEKIILIRQNNVL